MYMYLLSSAEGARAVVVGLHAASGEAASFLINSDEVKIILIAFLYCNDLALGEKGKQIPYVLLTPHC